MAEKPNLVSPPFQHLTVMGELAKGMFQLTPIRKDVERIALDSPYERVRVDQHWNALARDHTAIQTGQIGDIDARDRITWIEHLAPLPKAEEPFLAVRLRSPRGEMYFGEIDRPVGEGDEAMQLEARILELSPITRAFSPDHGLATHTATITLQNDDGALNELLRNPRASFLQTEIDLLIGFRSIPPRFYRPIGPGWIISRVSRVTTTTVTLELRDISERRLGSVVDFPVIDHLRHELLAAVKDELGDFDPLDPARIRRQAGVFAPGEDINEPVRVPMGRELIHIHEIGFLQGAFLQAPEDEDWGEGYTNAIGVYLLGASLLPNAAPARGDLTDEQDDDPDNQKRRMRLFFRGPDSFINALAINTTGGVLGLTRRPKFVMARVRRLKFQAHGKTWYAWILIIGARKNTSSADEGEFRRSTRWMVEFFKNAKIYVQFPEGAEGSPTAHMGWWAGRHDGSAIFAEVAARYLQDAHGLQFDEPNFLEASDESSNREWRHTRVAGELRSGQTGAEVLDAIGRTHELDFYFSWHGRLRVRPARATAKDISDRIPAARVYDAQWDIIRGSWEERIPLASERWGIATLFRPTAQKEDQVSPDIERIGEEERAEWGRILETDVEYSWWDRMVFAGDAVKTKWQWGQRLDKFQHTIRFHTGIQGLELELGDYLRVTNKQGIAEDGGYEERLLRVEGLTLHWHLRQVEVVAIDMSWVEDGFPGVLDDETHWTRLEVKQPDGMTRISATSDSVLVQLQGDRWEEAGIKVGDVIRMPAEDGYGEIVRQIQALAKVGSNWMATLDEPMGETRTIETFRAERTHTDPPTEAEWPGRYPVTSKAYVRLADEESGTFSDGTPGYRLQQE